jgi:DNA replication and repair protein RecF
MQISHLSLTNFRNYGRLELDFTAGATLLYGDNAQGKTNLLEAICYLATTRSPFADSDSQLINWEAGQYDESISVGRIVAHVVTSERTKRLELRLIHEVQGNQVSFRREALVDRRKVRLMDLLGELRVVLFLPEDVGLITGSPSDRRRYINITLCQSDRSYCRTLSAYNKILEQRNALLRQLAEQGVTAAKGPDVLSIYSTQLVEAGSLIFARRAQFMRELGRRVQRVHYEQLTAGRETLRLTYLPRLARDSSGRSQPDSAELLANAEWLDSEAHDPQAVAKRFAQEVVDAIPYDLLRGSTSVGPHRDDWRFWINGRSLNQYGSRGQQRSAVLALKLAEIGWISAETNDTPVLLLDDVMAELDAQRRKLLLQYLPTVKQALITTTDRHIFSSEFQKYATVLSVSNGRVQTE